MIHMHAWELPVGSGRTVSVRVAETPGMYLLECPEPRLLLDHLQTDRPWSRLPEGAYLRGIRICGEGARFDLMDGLGVAVADVVHLDEVSARRLLGSLPCDSAA